MDADLAELATAAPDAAILLSADHGMNFKSRSWDLEKALRERGAPVRIAISAERDKYVRHHQGMGGTAWIHPRAGGIGSQPHGEPPRRSGGAGRSRYGVRQSRCRHGSDAEGLPHPRIAP